MIFKNKTFNKFWRFSSSFQLGIPIMIVITVLIAWGTIVESRYDAQTAKKMVYDSWMMWVAMSLLVYNLVVVVVDRWPWQLKHYPFITVHAGLILIVFGGYLTSRFGVDGQMMVNINGKNNMVSVGQTDLVVYATFNGDNYSKMVDREVDFFKNPPTSEKPYVIDLGNDKIELLEHARYARLQNKIKASSEESAGSSVRFQIKNANVQQVEQITQAKKDKIASFNLGPAKIHLGSAPSKSQNENEIYLTPLDENRVRYTIHNKDASRPSKKGVIKIGESFLTGWMGLEFKMLDYLPKAKEDYEVTKLDRPTQVSTSAVKIKHKNLEKWLALNDVVKLFGDSSAYLLSYQNRRLDLGFELKLDRFEVQRYQGTMRAKEYASHVEVLSSGGKFDQVISMNEPLKFNGYTIYQASFQEDQQTGEPTASVFSINRDPGRMVKYFGSIILSLGTIWLFYQRRKKVIAV